MTTAPRVAASGAKTLEAPPRSFAIIGFGKLGGLELGPGSDLDIVFLHDLDPQHNRFLHRMVRFLVGMSVDVALGRRPVGDIPLLLSGTDNAEASPPAPPEGLYFVRARYDHLQLPGDDD